MQLIRKAFPLLLPMVVAAVGIIGLWQLGAKPRGQFKNDIPVGELLTGGSVGQSLVVERQGLYRIDVLLATYARENHGPVIFRLKASPSDLTDLVALTFDAADVQNNTFHAFKFKPLSLPIGASLYFGFEAFEARPGNALTIWGTQANSFPEGEAVFVDLPNPNGVQDLAFKVYYQPGLLETVGRLSDRLTSNKPVPFAQPFVYAGLGLLYLYLLFRLGSAFAFQLNAGMRAHSTEEPHDSDHPIRQSQPKL